MTEVEKRLLRDGRVAMDQNGNMNFVEAVGQVTGFRTQHNRFELGPVEVSYNVK